MGEIELEEVDAQRLWAPIYFDRLGELVPTHGRSHPAAPAHAGGPYHRVVGGGGA